MSSPPKGGSTPCKASRLQYKFRVIPIHSEMEKVKNSSNTRKHPALPPDLTQHRRQHNPHSLPASPSPTERTLRRKGSRSVIRGSNGPSPLLRHGGGHGGGT
mmetsp:Transcript_123636/g.276026  ORF Transcript_123636/g.276026 Transcript_123636/m.276026 type:complete len:102 (+) Transcript_123636:179-484(+)